MMMILEVVSWWALEWLQNELGALVRGGEMSCRVNFEAVLSVGMVVTGNQDEIEPDTDVAVLLVKANVVVVAVAVDGKSVVAEPWPSWHSATSICC